MESEFRAVFEAIGALSSDSNEEEISSVFSATRNYLSGILGDNRQFLRLYVAICAKVFQLTCKLPYEPIHWLANMGVAGDVISTLCTCISTSSLQGCQEIQVVLKEFCKDVKGSKLEEMLWHDCTHQHLVSQQTLTNVINLPQLLANQLKLELDEVFIPRAFNVTVMSTICNVLSRVAMSTGSHNYTLHNIAYLMSRIITSGDQGAALTHLVSYLDKATLQNMLWQRICCVLIGHFSISAVDTFVEHVLLLTKPSLASSSGACRILGNSLETQRRLTYTLSHKCLLIQCYDSPWLLYNVAGYLRSSLPGQQLMQQTLSNLLKVWSDVSIMCHLDCRHLLHISRAIVLFTCCLGNDNMLSSHMCSDMFRQLMQGTQHHMSNPMVDQRSVAMRLAECVSQKLVNNGKPLQFEIAETEETLLLASMATPIAEQEEQLSCKRLERSSQHQSKNQYVDHVIQPTGNVQMREDSDDDDDLVPFDMTSHDTPNVPHYLREAISNILEGKGNQLLNTLEALPNLIKSHPHDLAEVCDELCKVLLHCYSEESRTLTKQAIVSLICSCPVQTANYLINQFCCHGYNTDQRLFVLDVLSASCQHLSSSYDLEGANQFFPVAGHFFYPLLKCFEQLEVDELIAAHVIHTLAHVVHCAALSLSSGKMSEHLLELLAQYKSHQSAFVRQSTLCGISIVITSTSLPPKWLPFTRDWLKDVVDNDSNHHCRSLASASIQLLQQ